MLRLQRSIKLEEFVFLFVVLIYIFCKKPVVAN